MMFVMEVHNLFDNMKDQDLSASHLCILKDILKMIEKQRIELSSPLNDPVSFFNLALLNFIRDVSEHYTSWCLQINDDMSTVLWQKTIREQLKISYRIMMKLNIVKIIIKIFA